MGRMRAITVWGLFSLLIFLVSGVSLSYAQTNTFPSDGNVGIGTTNPNANLHVRESGLFTNIGTDSGRSYVPTTPILTVTTDGNGVASAFYATNAVFKVGIGGADTGNVTTEWFRVNLNGNVGIGTTSPTSKLHVAGDAVIDGNIAAKYQDVAEWVRTPAQLAPGTVVVIDSLESNRVVPSFQAYDSRIAGVVSSQPGIILGEAGEDKAKVAHSGRVKVKADAQFGPISVGDLLVSSGTSGYAMRSAPVEVNGVSIHRPGTIVGKALEPLKEGQGEILVLLTLQ